MAEFVKPWASGGNLSATYEGSGDGSAIFSSDENKGAEREMDITFVDVMRNVFVVRKVRQAAGQSSAETYTRLTYIESTGKQYINLGYVVQEADEIEIRYATTQLESGRLFGTLDATGNSIYFSFSNKNAYARFGTTNSTSIANGIRSNNAILKKGNVLVNAWSANLAFVGMPTNPLYLFASCDDNGATAYASFRCMRFVIRKGNGETMELLPYRRNADGAVGMLDMDSGIFYENEGDGEFIAGSEIHLPNGYALIDSVDFNADKLFDVATITQDDSIDIMYQRDYVSKAQYLYGVLSNGNTASFTAYLSATGAWRFGNQLVRPNAEDLYVHRTLIANGNASRDCSALILNKSVNFTTPDTFVLGGYREIDGSTYATYIGKVFYLRVNNGDLLDWIPCVNPEGVEGFWDCKSNTFIEPY